MAVRGQTRTYSDRRVERGSYIYGNTARQLDVRRAIAEPVRRENHAVRRNREKAAHMNPGYVLFLATALIAAGIILIGYIRLQSELTNSIKHISVLESQLNDLKLSNDEEYSRIESSVNLEEVKRIAIDELGMTYPSEGQIVTYSAEGSDYVRQIADIPEK